MFNWNSPKTIEKNVMRSFLTNERTYFKSYAFKTIDAAPEIFSEADWV